MSTLSNKQYREYSKLSRYSSFPIYYHTKDDKYIAGTTAYLRNDTPHTSYIVAHNDTWDSIALKFYNNPTLYWIICSFNHIQDPYINPKQGSIVHIPSISTIEFETNER